MKATAPGHLVDLGTHRLHLRCEGTGTPAVIFDAALGASSLSWSLVQPAVARVTTACAYDRAGFGWSDAGPMPRTAGRIAAELHDLVRVSRVPPPYVLVGHSFGGLVMRMFASRHPGEVAGLVLIEPAIPEEWAAPGDEQRSLIARGARLCAYGRAAAKGGLARAVAALVGLGALGPARALVRLISRGGLSRDDEGVLAPIWKLPPDARGVLRQAWTQPKFFEALGSQISTICDSAVEVLHAAPHDYADLPLAVVSAAAAKPRRLEADAQLAQMSTRGRHVLAPNSGHWVPLDNPQAVIDAITDVVMEVRRDGGERAG